MLKLTGIHYSYGKIAALKGIDLEVDEGEIVCLLGTNGAGKSTTLMNISGIFRPAQGKIEFNNVDITRKSPQEIVAMGISQAPEGRHIFPSLSVKDNLRTGVYGRLAQMKPSDILEDLYKIYALFPRLKEREQQLAGTLSGGEQQMLAIGRALMAEPKILLLDEPSLGLAPKLSETIFSTIKEINLKGTSVLLVEQNAVAALELADRGYVMETGKIVLSGKAADLKNDNSVQRYYLGMEVNDEKA